jgi:hypothetical protein
MIYIVKGHLIKGFLNIDFNGFNDSFWQTFSDYKCIGETNNYNNNNNNDN